MTNLQKFKKLMNNFKVEVFEEVDEFNCIFIRLKNNHHNTIPLFYFDENGKFIEVDTAIANNKCQVCGAVVVCENE